MAVTNHTRQLARARRSDIVSMTDETVVALVTAWATLWDDLEVEYDQLVQELVSQHPDGATPAQLDSAERIISAMDTTHSRLEDLVGDAADRIVRDIGPIVAKTPTSVLEGLASQLPAPAAFPLAKVNEAALAAIVARSTSQIHSQTQPLTPQMETAMKRQLTQGIVAGANPRETARKIVRDTEGAFFGGVARAARIARTEQIDAHRAAHLATIEANTDLVTGRVWLATADARTCMSCVAMSGTEFPADAFGPEDHPQGRCVFIDKIRPWSELGIESPEPPDVDTDLRGWFDGLTEDTQRSMLGPGRFELWQSGQIGWDDLSVRRENSEWRAAYYERPLKDLSGQET